MSSELATVLRGLADYLDTGNNRADDKPGTKAADKPKQTRKPAAPKVKKEEVIKAFQELSKLPGGRAKIDDILEDNLPEKTPLKAGNLKPAQYATVLEATKLVIEETKANPDTDGEDEGFD